MESNDSDKTRAAQSRAVNEDLVQIFKQDYSSREALWWA